MLLSPTHDKAEIGLERFIFLFFFIFFNPSELHILHPLAYKSPCAVCLKALLAPGSVNLFVVHLLNGRQGEKKEPEMSCWHWSCGKVGSAEFQRVSGGGF